MKSKKINSRISGFYKKSIRERLEFLHQENILDEHDFDLLINGNNIIKSQDADKMIENVIGFFGLPLGLGFNFLINDKDYIIPMVVEEPSVVAAVSAAAKVVRVAGGFTTESQESILVGQVQLVDIKDMDQAGQAILDSKKKSLNLPTLFILK